MNLTDREKEMLKAMIDRGEPLPPRYRLSLFADAPEVELIWQGKTNEVTNVVLCRSNPSSRSTSHAVKA